MARTDSPFESHQYLAWLVDQIAVPDDGHTYNAAMNMMYTQPFPWIVGNDENRVADGRDLRIEYIQLLEDKGKGIWIEDHPITLLEVLVALSRRIGFLVEQDPRDWAWHFIRVLKLDRYDENISGTVLGQMQHTMERLVWRTYEPDGSGGFFPLRHPKGDQRKVEIWDQMTAYINENRASFGL